MTFDDEEVKILWAAMCAMMEDIHSPQDCLSKAEWELAEKMHGRLDVRVNEMAVENETEPLKDITGCDV